MKKVNTTKAPAAIGPYAQAVAHNGILFVSGQIPINPENGEQLHGIEVETHQVMKNLQAILAEANTDFSKVIKATIFLKDLNDFATVNEIYGSYFSEGNYPARECVQVAKLPKDVSVEISVIAAV
ncbi:RidA family protein [Ornithobacterium rhinotracheale]|uniref:RidA family protein n=1 Tax=Ornithobacterium rhinotracheale TaxID=28251 RepID=UPI00129CCF6C|nr:RidA family protein [Ornithobacterium rhinotracheale]MRI63480.1 RidA family protein [Ornithobacterium rhinotracheale]